MAPKKITVQLTGILVADAEQRGFTGYFAEFPEAVADGATEQEVKENMFEALKIILETRRAETEPTAIKGTIEENFELELA